MIPEGLVKRGFDVLFSFLGLIILFPVFLIVAVLTKLEDGGPVFYRGVRVGQHGRLFRIFKFRSMVVDAERIGGPSTADDDPRVTGIGEFLRKYKLDELPQLLNVLMGDMSLVGPRPEVPLEVETYSAEERRIVGVKPGITDYATLFFHDEGEILRGSTNPHQTYREKIRPEKLRLALKYVDERCFWVDLKIIIDTLLTLVKTRAGR